MVFAKKSVVDRKRKSADGVKAWHERNRLKKAREQGEFVPSGRRIFEVALLGQNMWCHSCDIPLSFRFMEQEHQKGLASVFKIRCYKCLAVYDVASSTTSADLSGSGRSLFSVNLKLALGKCIFSWRSYLYYSHQLFVVKVYLNHGQHNLFFTHEKS